MLTYNPFDISLVQENTASTSFQEVILSSIPNSLIGFNSMSSVISIPSNNGGYDITASYASVAGFALGGNITSSISSSYSATSSYALGGNITASITDPFHINTIEDKTSRYKIQVNSASMFDAISSISVDWNNRILSDSGTMISVDWEDRMLDDNRGIYSINYQNRLLIDFNTTNSIDYTSRYLLDNTGSISVDWNNKLLNGSWINGGNFSINGSSSLDNGNIKTDGTGNIIFINNGILYDTTVTPAVNISLRNLKDSNNTTSIDWGHRILSGSWTTNNLTGSFFGTSSWANNSLTSSYVKNSLTSSYITSSNIIGTVISSSYSITASYVTASNISGIVVNALTASYVAAGNVSGNVATSSWAVNSQTASNLNFIPLTSSYSNTSSYSVSSSYSVTSSYSKTSSYAGTGPFTLIATGSSYPITASWALNSQTSSYVTSSNIIGTVISSSYALSSSNTITSSYSLLSSTSSWAINSQTASSINFTPVSASYSNTASYSLTGPFTLLATGSNYPITASWAFTSSYITASNVIGTVISSSYALTSSYAGTGPFTLIATGSSYPITASWALNSQTASSINFVPQSSSYAITSSFALNGGGSSITSSYLSGSQYNYGFYQTNLTNSANWITVSFQTPNQVINLTNTASYSFTQSNISLTGQISNTIVYISASYTSGTSSLTFPSNWQNIGGGWPTILNSKEIAVIWLSSVDTYNIEGTYNYSGSNPSASYALTASYALNGGSGGSLGTGLTYPFTSSWVLNSLTSSYILNGGTQLGTGSTYPITASWSLTSSFLAGGISGLGGTSGSALLLYDSNLSEYVAITSNNGILETTPAGSGSGPAIQIYSVTSSYAYTSSWSLNSLTSSYISPYFNYYNVVTSSTNWITCSFIQTNQLFTINRSTLYSFTSSNNPSSGQMADIIMVISNSVSNATSSLSFPANWIYLGSGSSWPTSITSSQVATMWLRGINQNQIIGTFVT